MTMTSAPAKQAIVHPRPAPGRSLGEDWPARPGAVPESDPSSQFDGIQNSQPPQNVKTAPLLLLAQW